MQSFMYCDNSNNEGNKKENFVKLTEKKQDGDVEMSEKKQENDVNTPLKEKEEKEFWRFLSKKICISLSVHSRIEDIEKFECKEIFDIFLRKNKYFERDVVIICDDFDVLMNCANQFDNLLSVLRYIKTNSGTDYCLKGFVVAGIFELIELRGKRDEKEKEIPKRRFKSPFSNSDIHQKKGFDKEDARRLVDMLEKEKGKVVEPEVLKNVFNFTGGICGYFKSSKKNRWKIR